MKSGPFAEHSPLLNSAASKSSWSKIVSTLIQTYHEDVLLKFPVAQHIYFGRLFSFDKFVLPPAPASATSSTPASDNNSSAK